MEIDFALSSKLSMNSAKGSFFLLSFGSALRSWLPLLIALGGTSEEDPVAGSSAYITVILKSSFGFYFTRKGLEED